MGHCRDILPSLSWAGYILRWHIRPKVVTDPSTNEFQCRKTSLLWRTTLPLCQTANQHYQQLENRPRLRIEVSLTALQTETLTLTPTFNPMTATVMPHTHTIGQGQRSLSSKVRLETDRGTKRRTDGCDCMTSHANVAGNNDELASRQCALFSSSRPFIVPSRLNISSWINFWALSSHTYQPSQSPFITSVEQVHQTLEY